MPSAVQSRRASPEVRRAQILDAAQACFSRKGYHGATMDDVVRLSGLSKGSLYWHFESKDEVLLALFDRYVDEFFAAWDPSALPFDASLVELVGGGAELFLEKMAEQLHIAGNNRYRNITVETIHATIETAIQTVVFQSIDCRFNGWVMTAALDEFTLTLPLFVSLRQAAFFRENHGL